MRLQTLILIISTTGSALQIPSFFSPPEPFYAPLTQPLSLHESSSFLNNDTIIPPDSPLNSPTRVDLVRRASTTSSNICPANYNSCSTLRAADVGACCPASATCSTDASRNVACCPIGASCTGTITTNSRATHTSPASASATQTGNFVTNPYFPFPILPTSYVNEAACTSATDSCAQNYALCTVDLEGGMGGGVTVSAPNGGVTVAASTVSGGFLGAASAASVCQSLSSVACNDVESAGCAKFGTGTATTTGSGASFIIGTNAAAARPTIMGCIPYAAAVMGLGVMGQMV